MHPLNTRFLITSLFLAMLSACTGESVRSAQSAPSGSSVSIVELAPSPSETLVVGQKVSLKVKASYTLTAESGTLGLVVQDAGTVGIAQTMAVVAKGSGTEQLAVEFVVPETRAVQVFVPLSGQEQTSTATVSSRAYKVVPR